MTGTQNDDKSGSKLPVTRVHARKIVSVKELADHLGITPRQVYKLISEGKIEKPESGIVLEEAVGQYHSRTSPQHRMADALARGKTVAPAAVAIAPARPRPKPEPRRQSSDDDDDEVELFDYQESRAKREMHNANLAELKELQARGDLLRRDIVVAREFEIARKLRDRILAFPARVANFVGSDAMKTLTMECEALVAELQEEVSRIAEACD